MTSTFDPLGLEETRKIPIFSAGVAVGFIKNDTDGNTTVGNPTTAVIRSAQVGTDIDMLGDEIKTMTLTGNTVFTISNPTAGRMIILEIDGTFTVTLPASVVVVNGDYLPLTGKNFLHLFCTDDVTPEYLATWSVTI